MKPSKRHSSNGISNNFADLIDLLFKARKRKKAQNDDHSHESHRDFRSTEFENDGCKVPVKFPCERCEDNFRVNLAGLTRNLNFNLLNSKGCKVEIETTSGLQERGKIFDVGIDFIELKKENGDIVTILKDNIDEIQWLDDK